MENSSRRRETFVLEKILVTWNFTVASEISRSLAISLFDRRRFISSRTAVSRFVSFWQNSLYAGDDREIRSAESEAVPQPSRHTLLIIMARPVAISGYAINPAISCGICCSNGFLLSLWPIKRIFAKG